jgi:hypothetical protein
MYIVQHCINAVQTFILSVNLLTNKIGKWGTMALCIDVPRQVVETGNFKPRRISADISTLYTLYWIVPPYGLIAPSLFSRPVRLNSSGGTTVSDISENDTSLPKVHWSVLVLSNLPGRPEPWDSSIWRGYFGELEGLDLLKLGAEPDVLGGLKDTGGLNSLLKFFHVMGDFG